jgi:hypothetical protein
MNVWSNRRLCFGDLLTDVYEDLLKKEGGGDDLILPKRVEDVWLVAKRYKRYAGLRAERQGPRYAAGIHEPPVDEADATSLKKKPTLNTPRQKPQDNNEKLYDLRPRRPAAVCGAWRIVGPAEMRHRRRRRRETPTGSTRTFVPIEIRAVPRPVYGGDIRLVDTIRTN